MDTLSAILSRKSIRYFQDKPVPEDAVSTILKAGMAGPTAVNARDWSFIVVTDRDRLDRMAAGNGPAADPLRRAPLGILLCGDVSRSFVNAPDYWIIDGAIAGQNMLLAAHELGLGGVWLGTWPQEEKMAAQAALFGLPDHIKPHSLFAFGYPPVADDDPKRRVKPDWEADRVHYEVW